MQSQENRRFVIYSRKSKFTGKGESIENQVEMCRQYLAVHYGEEEAGKALVYEDEGFSGGTLERPNFKRMMKDAQRGGFSAIVVYRLDRISRNIGDFAALIERLNRLGTDFISIKEQFDTGSPMGRAMMYISSVFSQLERETIAERIRDNMRELAKTGRWLGGVTPTGYESESVFQPAAEGKAKRLCKLKSIPEELRLVELIFDTFLETGSLTRTDAFLLEKRYRTKQGRPFTRFAIRGILTNPVYMIADGDAYRYLTSRSAGLFAGESDFDGRRGVMAYNRTLQQPGKNHQIKPVEEWIVSVGEHEGIIPGAKWAAVQERLERNRSKSYRNPRSHAALLSGLLSCGSCGDYMRPKLTSRQTDGGERLFTYLCGTKERSRGRCCTMKNACGNLLDAGILEELKKLEYDRAHFIRQLDQGRRALTGGQEGCAAALESLNARLSENEETIRSLVAAFSKASGTAAEGYILRQIEELHGEGEGLRKQREELESEAVSHRLDGEEAERILSELAGLESVVGRMSAEQKRAAVRALVRQAVWDGEKLHLYLSGSAGAFRPPRPLDGGEPLREDSK
ncbi:MAG: recombinase family protein [Provencibacterium sp.]|jgi:DNA invertase Pin-like site-specific DNA recombinase|nr:recombinase family protein [Provencibacterium sp.]